jgi:hypothetical protein
MTINHIVLFEFKADASAEKVTEVIIYYFVKITGISE